MNRSPQKAIIVGAGPAGLTVALELVRRTDIKPIVLEKSDELGGISRTVKHNGNHIDIGGHRFFTKSNRVQEFWESIMPIRENGDVGPTGSGTDDGSSCFMVRKRLSRILFKRRLFDYPLSLTVETMKKLGYLNLIRCGFSYVLSSLFPIRDEKNLEDFFINRFGRELYQTFFKDYTEKVWGVSCQDIPPEWGKQRIKTLSVWRAVMHSARSLVSPGTRSGESEVETSLIGSFIYPMRGPGEFWEAAAREIEAQGGKVVLNSDVRQVQGSADGIHSVVSVDPTTGKESTYQGEYFFSSMPIQELIASFSFPVPPSAREIGENLQYRDFITIGLLLDDMSSPGTDARLPDNWIYVQEPYVKVGRLQIFNNWSPYMVKDPSKLWVGLEYFCQEGDELWSMSEQDLSDLAIEELQKLDLVAQNAAPRDSVIIRVPKAYPSYLGSYLRFPELQEFIDGIPNLYLVGRNGMHRYNNQDHSILTAMKAVDHLLGSTKSKNSIWMVNAEKSYHEELRREKVPDI